MRSASVPLDAAGALPVEDELALVDREGVLVGEAMEGLAKGLAVEVEHRPARLAEEMVILLQEIVGIEEQLQPIELKKLTEALQLKNIEDRKSVV